MGLKINGFNIGTIKLNGNIISQAKLNGNVIYSAQEAAPSPEGDYLLFHSDNGPFTLKTAINTKNWDGILEYSTDAVTWNIWYGTTTLSSGGVNDLCLRGTGNTYLTNSTMTAAQYNFRFTGTRIRCVGNIENLLDYQTVANGNHPTMGIYCFAYLFSTNSNLIQAPELPATTLASSCYRDMFNGCTSLTTAPQLPATTLASSCYRDMFNGCTSLTTAPQLPATTLASSCYRGMFNGCTSIKLSETQTSECPYEYRIPTSFEGTVGTNSLVNMFANTGGTFTGTPEINTTYYTNNTAQKEKEVPILNVTVTGPYASYISGCGAGIDNNGKLVIWAKSNTGDYEHISYVASNISVGEVAEGWDITTFDTGTPTDIPHAFTVTGLGEYNIINIELNVNSLNDTRDYMIVGVTLTAS